MRVGILGLLHESNTFISQPTTLEHFQQDLLLTGEAVRDRTAGTHHELGGFFAGLEQAGITAVPIFAARAVPFGTIAAEAFAELLNRLFAALDQAGPVDGILAAPHGATVAASHPDADGHWLGEVRRRLGPDRPLIATLDPHANLSPRMVAACDAITAYRTNPHLDQRVRGIEAATLMARTLRGEIRPTMAAEFPPLAINIERQLTSEPHLRPLYELADDQLRRPNVLSNSIVLGFPYADVEELGSSVIAVTNNDWELARQTVRELSHAMWTRRADFVAQLTSVEDAIDQATRLASPGGPVLLLDMGDNVGGGSPADGTVLAHALQRRRCAGSFVCLYDPPASEQAREAGVGQTVTLTVGGRCDSRHGEPLTDSFRVISLHDGRFEELQPRHGGFTKYDQGPTAIVRSDDGLTLMLTSRRMPPFSLQQLLSCGVDPASLRLIVAKGVNAPVAAYAPVCPHMIRVNTPGSTTADMRQLDYRHRRRPLFPLEPL